MSEGGPLTFRSKYRFRAGAGYPVPSCLIGIGFLLVMRKRIARWGIPLVI